MDNVVLAERRVLVVGGTSGIGLAIATAATRCGAAVTVAGRRQPLRLPPGIEYQVADATLRDDWDALFDHLGRVDHVVASIGAGAVGTIAELDLDAAHRYVDAKLWGYIHCLRAAPTAMPAAGSITLIGGGLSRNLASGQAMMTTVNAAVEALTKAAALELAPLRVNAIAPGLIDTPAHDRLPAEARARMYEGYAARVPAGRVGRGADIAQAAIFLMTNSFVTGTVMDIDGGALLV